MCSCCVVIIQEEKSTSVFDIPRYLIRSKEWVSRLVLISFTLHLIRLNALPARPLPVNSGKPQGTKTYTAIGPIYCVTKEMTKPRNPRQNAAAEIFNKIVKNLEDKITINFQQNYQKFS